MTHIIYRLTAKNQDQLRNPTLGNRVWAIFTFFTCCKQSRNIEQLGLELSDIFMCFVLQYDTDSWPSLQVDVMLFCECRDAVRCQATAGTAAAGAVAASWTFHAAEATSESAAVCCRRTREQDDRWQPCHLVCATHYCASKGLHDSAENFVILLRIT